MSGTSGGYSVPHATGTVALPAVLNLQPTASGTWADSTLDITLPDAGTYRVFGTVIGGITGTNPVSANMQARLFNVTAGAPVAGSATWVVQINSNATTSASTDNQSAPMFATVTVPGPTVLRLQGNRINNAGATTFAAIESAGSSLTALWWERIA